MAGAMRVEENVSREHPPPSHFLYQMHKKKMFDLENEGQGHRIQHSQWRDSMANVNL